MRERKEKFPRMKKGNGRNSFQKFISETDILLPVEFRDVMFSGPDMVSDDVSDGRVQLSHFRDRAVGKRFFDAEEFIDGNRVEAGKVLAFRVGPLVILRTGGVDRTRSGKRDEFVLVDGEIIDARTEFTEIRAEPVAETAAHGLDGLAKFTPTECRTAAARIV